ncbi:MAG TPA: DUF4349 domain-containing protein [Accumulibacter sp.]|nr:DUF4349 domain-containing protein [Accumulibacter sp.]HQC80713.1 DUF4349 domain-containing protein [Accumulibacter sp.]
MIRSLLVLLVFVFLAGCARKNESGVLVPAQAPVKSTEHAARYLAYEHAIHLDTDEQQLSAVVDMAQTACRQASDELCTVLESRVSTGKEASASLRFRARPEGIRKLIDVLSQQAELVDQSTTAEDLTAPIEDAARKLEMLRDYRTRLEALRGRASHDVDALIKINRELSQVQSELEAGEGGHARLMQRVQTEILNVSIRTTRHQSFWKPVVLAMSDFGANFSQGLSMAITSVAYLIPGVLPLALLVWIARRAWRRRRGAAREKS